MILRLRIMFVLALLVSGIGAQAAELVMFERAGCVWCRKWDIEVGSIYPKSAEGQRVPLRRASLDQLLPPDLILTPPVFYSPTFVLMHEGRELGRITGYQGEEAFWGLLGSILEKTEGSKR
jgi:hypothetical protein